MRTVLIFSVLLFFLLEAPCVPAAESAKLKHNLTLYADNASLPFKYPEGVACNSSSLLVGDTGNSRIVRFAIREGAFAADAVFPLAQTSSPIVVQMNSKGEIYVLDGKERRILKLGPSGESQGYLTPKAVPPPAKIVPRSFKIDTKDNIYLLDILSQRVIVLNSDAQYVRHIALPEGHDFFSDIAVTSQGVTYLLGSLEAVVYKAAPEAGAFKPLTKPMKDLMNFPNSIALDNSGNLYIVDQYGSGLDLVESDGVFLGRKIGMGWGEGQLHYPAQICINELNTIFIADRNNNRLQVFDILKKQE